MCLMDDEHIVRKFGVYFGKQNIFVYSVSVRFVDQSKSHFKKKFV